MLQRLVMIVLLLCCAPIHAQKPMETAPANSPRVGVRINSFLPREPLSRARRAAPLVAVIENLGDSSADVRARLILPAGVKALHSNGNVVAHLEAGQTKKLIWQVESDAPQQCNLRLELTAGDANVQAATLPMLFLPPAPIRKLRYIPAPIPVHTSILIGAHNCPLWESDKPEMWSNVLNHPERMPALGLYGQENPEVSDWETKWAVEHGISFFVYCWYRASQGGPVQMHFGSAIHKALYKSRYGDQMKFTIMWENQSRGTAGVSGEKDLMENLLPFWIENYFKRPNYLKVDNKPVLFIYRPEFLIQDLGSVENVARAFEKMRAACKAAGFDGLTILGEYRGLDPAHFTLMKQLGLDYTFAYCWPIGNNPTPPQAVAAQMDSITKTQALHILPQVVTLSQAWSGWSDEGTIWKIPPRDFETLLGKAKEFVAALPPTELGSKMLLLDNWNEWGEGHYIAPYREYGFGYLDAVRNVFSDAPPAHTDLLPEDIGLGPYDTAYTSYREREDALQELRSVKAAKPGSEEAGLVGWWSFDKEQDSRVALDDSGHRLGGDLRGATRAKGIDGSALVCDGGCVVIQNNPVLSPTAAMTLECWVKSDRAGQGNTWFINRVYGGGTSTGYRMGVLDGKPCFEIPQTDWSHHLKAREDLPTGRWVYLAGTFDGKTMRIYVDGIEQGSMERPGPINPNTFHLCLGSYDENHPAHFWGLLDEVKLYGRALSPEEIKAHYRLLAEKSAVQ